MKRKLLFEEPTVTVMNFAVEDVVTASDKPGIETPDDVFPF